VSRYLTLEEAVTKVVAEHGGIRATERAVGLDKSFLSRLMRGEKTNPSEETLAKLGLRAVPRYERIKDTK
jgi:transcriptional regulator with XRE-family HTH domain